jgi:hypothetical protein
MIVSNYITSYTTGSQLAWPNVTMKNWDILTTEAFDRTVGPELYLFAPVVPNAEKNAWQEYAVANQGWIEEDLDLRGLQGVDPGEISDEIYAYNFDTETYYNFSLPVWQVGPVPTNSDMIMLDLYTQASFRRMVDDVNAVRHILLSEVVDRTFFSENIETIESDPSRDHHPRSFAAQPVFETFSSDAAIKAFVFAVIPWDTYFVGVLPYGIEGLVVRVDDTCGSGFSYLVNGPNATYLGPEYVPEQKYEYLSQSAEFAAFSRYTEDTVVNDEIQYCSYMISIHATTSYAEGFQTQKPLYLTVVVLLVFLFTALVFVLYDVMVQRRQKKVMKTAEKTTAIVSSLFPKNVRNRILAAAMEDEPISRLSKSGKDKLKNYFAGGIENKDEVGTGGANPFDKPIADFFPETTIMFADLVGTSTLGFMKLAVSCFTPNNVPYGFL